MNEAAVDPMPGALAEAMAEAARAVVEELEILLPEVEAAERPLFDAMRYACLTGGKRLRPFLVLTASELFNVARLSALRTAAAVEMVHCYSLVHDDLPAMDDDDLRRGQPTVHVKYDEATAILAGDALLTRAFGVLADADTHADPSVRATLVSELSRAAGPHGMVGGQALDLIAERAAFDVNQVIRMQQLKTGRLIQFSSVAGAILGKAPAAAYQALQAYSHDLGLAFQIVDDLLDATGDAGTAGKNVNKDAARGKATFVSLMGVDGARDHARILIEQAVSHLDDFDGRADLLRMVARYILNRTG